MSPDGQSALIWLIIGILILLIHFVPSFIAYSRNHPSKLAILILNILLGWTGIGWIILVFWATRD